MKKVMPILVFLALAALVSGNVAFFLFLVSLMVLPKVLGAVADRATRDGSGKTAGWKQKLDQALAEIRREMEARTTVPPEEKTVWDQLMGDGAGEEAAGDEPAEDLDLGPLPKPEPAPAARRSRLERAPETGAASVSDRRTAREAEPQPPPQPAYRRRRRRFSPQGMRLQDAVVWSEILAPPLALREGPEQGVVRHGSG